MNLFEYYSIERQILEEKYYKSPLHVACIEGSIVLVEKLINDGANIDELCSRGITSLYYTCMNPNSHILDCLIKNGANVNIVREFCFLCRIDSSPLHCLCDVDDGDESIKCMKLLIEAKADFNAVDALGQTPLHNAVGRNSPIFVELLLSSGADIDIQDVDGKTPLHLAIAYSHFDCAKILLDNGANTSLENKEGIKAQDMRGIEGRKFFDGYFGGSGTKSAI